MENIKVGIGIHNLDACNLALGAKLSWQMYSQPNAKWCKIVQSKYLDTSNPVRIFIAQNPPTGSTMWNFISSCRDVVLPYLSWKINNGEQALFWDDSWNIFPPHSNVQELILIKQVLKAT